MLSMLNIWFLLENELKITINWGILTGVQYFIIAINNNKKKSEIDLKNTLP